MYICLILYRAIMRLLPEQFTYFIVFIIYILYQKILWPVGSHTNCTRVCLEVDRDPVSFRLFGPHRLKQTTLTGETKPGFVLTKPNRLGVMFHFSVTPQTCTLSFSTCPADALRHLHLPSSALQ